MGTMLLLKQGLFMGLVLAWDDLLMALMALMALVEMELDLPRCSCVGFV